MMTFKLNDRGAHQSPFELFWTDPLDPAVTPNRQGKPRFLMDAEGLERAFPERFLDEAPLREDFLDVPGFFRHCQTPSRFAPRPRRRTPAARSCRRPRRSAGARRLNYRTSAMRSQ